MSFLKREVKVLDLFCDGRDINLHFVESPALAPPEVQIDLAAQQQ